MNRAATDRGAFLLAMLSALLLGVAACDQAVEEGKLDGRVPDALTHLDAGVTDSGDTDTGARDGTPPDHGKPDLPPSKTVQVVYAGKTAVVGLTQPKSVTFEGTLHAMLADLVGLALPGKDQTRLQADFESSDGYRPSTKSTCNGVVPVAGSLFGKGYVDISTRKLRWDLALKYPGCLYVKDVAKIHLSDK